MHGILLDLVAWCFKQPAFFNQQKLIINGFSIGIKKDLNDLINGDMIWVI